MQLLPISPDEFSTKYWIKPQGYPIAIRDAVSPLVAHEVSRAVLSLPLGFVLQGNTFVLVAVMGLAPGRNLCVTSDGRWLYGYVPAAFRAYPFAVAETAEGGVLCFDQDSGLLSEVAGERFYEQDGVLSRGLQEIAQFLSEVSQNRQATARICAALQRHQLILPWTIKIQDDTGEQAINGLYRVDEAALNALSAKDFQDLRATGALPVAYCQLLSMQHLPKLAELAKAHQHSAQEKPVELSLDFLSGDNGTLNFS